MRSAPAASTSATCWPSRAKSDARIDGASLTDCFGVAATITVLASAMGNRSTLVGEQCLPVRLWPLLPRVDNLGVRFVREPPAIDGGRSAHRRFGCSVQRIARVDRRQSLHALFDVLGRQIESHKSPLQLLG